MAESKFFTHDRNTLRNIKGGTWWVKLNITSGRIPVRRERDDSAPELNSR